MEMRFSPHDLHLGSKMKRGCRKNRHGSPATPQHDDKEDDMSASLSLRNLSKVILPPLGVSSYNQNQIKSKGGIISPMDSRYRCWETFMALLVFYSAWVYPFEVAFLNASPKNELYIADNIVDLFFAIDIILTFFVAYIDRTSQLLVRDSRKIAVSLALCSTSPEQTPTLDYTVPGALSLFRYTVPGADRSKGETFLHPSTIVPGGRLSKGETFVLPAVY